MRRLLVLILVLVGLVPSGATVAADSYIGTPSAVTELNLYFPKEGESRWLVTLDWEEPASNGSLITSYEVYARVSTDSLIVNGKPVDTPWRLVYTAKSSKTELTFTLPLWARTQAVQFSLVAVNSFGRSHEPASGFVDVAIAKETACAVNEAGNAYCWGDSTGVGELGSSEVGFFEARRLMGLPAVSSIEAGDYHFCAVSAGNVYCWGLNDLNQVAASTDFYLTKPALVELPAKAIDISLGDSHSCALLETKDVFCWGSNEYDQLGSGVDGTVPSLVFSGTAKKLEAGGLTTCVVDAQSAIQCTGVSNNQFLAFGDDLGFSGSVGDIAAGKHAICAIVQPGVECRGFGLNGELGTTGTSSDTPRLVPSSTGFVEIYTKHSGVCAMRADREIFCWGSSWAEVHGWVSVPTDYENAYPNSVQTGFYAPVQLGNTGPNQLWDPAISDPRVRFASYDKYPYYQTISPYGPMLRGPVMIELGVFGDCAIDKFKQLWCMGRPQAGMDRVTMATSQITDANGAVVGDRFTMTGNPTYLMRHFITRPTFNYRSYSSGSYVDDGRDRPSYASIDARLSGTNSPGNTIEVKLTGVIDSKAKFDYIWYRGVGDFASGNFHNFRVMGNVSSAKYKVTDADRGYTFAVIPFMSSETSYNYARATNSLKPSSAATGGSSSNALGWTKRLGDTQAKLYAKDIIGAGKVVFKLNGKEIAWVNAADASDPKLRIVGDANYLVRTVNLAAGKNVLEVYINGERVKRTVYSR